MNLNKLLFSVAVAAAVAAVTAVAAAAGKTDCQPQRQRRWCCGAAWVTPPKSFGRFRAMEPSVTRTATAPEPPVSVASRPADFSAGCVDSLEGSVDS